MEMSKEQREIKFRGLHNGEWCYGYYFKHPTSDTHSIFLSDGNGSRVLDKESVGQYTGLKDKNGVEIYEGDIVRVIKRGLNQIHNGVIKMPKSCWVLEVSPNRWYRTAEYSQFEILGNIYQNADLLSVIRKDGV